MAKFADEVEPATTVTPGMTMAEQPAQQPAQTPCTSCAQPQPQQSCQQAATAWPQETRKIGDSKICPVCKTECNHLDYRRVSIDNGTVGTDGISHILDYTSEEDGNPHIVVFKCPHCYTILFDEEEDAVDFLE